VRVLFAGTPAVAVPSLDALVDAGFDVVGVLTRPDAPVGRKRLLTPSPVAQRAAELGLPLIRAAKVDAATTEAISALQPDVAAVVAYGALVPQAALDVPPSGWINLHFSLLPAWRGAAPVQHAILAGEEVTGASTFLLEKGLDTGPVFDTLTEPIRPTDTGSALLERLSHSGAVLLASTLKAIDAGHATPTPQQGTVTLAPKLSQQDGRIDWTRPAAAVDWGIRGVTFEPGAWTGLGEQRLKVGPVLLRPEMTDLQPGSVAVRDRQVLVGTGSHAVQLQQVQPAGKKLMQATDWVRGLAETEGVVFQ
jgi:methionyl-tRNA formyltransferase